MIFDSLTIIVCAVLVVLALFSTLLDILLKKLPADLRNESGSGCGPVSVVVIADNNARELKANLPAVLSQDYPAGYEVIVVVVKDDDGTSDVLNTFKDTGHLYVTFVPDSSRYMSRRKLAVTLGVKAAKNNWVLLTDASCRPATDKWITAMSECCTTGVDMVVGNSNYAIDAGHFKVFSRFHNEYLMLREAASGMAYGTFGRNLMFRKSMFMDGNGYQGNLKYLRGEYCFLVNKYAGCGSVAISTAHESLIVEDAPSRKEWHARNVFYRETRRHLERSLRHRAKFNADMAALHLCTLAALGSAVWASLLCRWTVLPVSATALVIPWIFRTLNARRAMVRLCVSVPAYKIILFELRLIWHNLIYMIAYKAADKYDFISHKS